jgi:polyisoprenoid-binding protein YceI
LLSSFGHNPRLSVREFTADIRVVPGKPETAVVQLKIRADSLQVIDDVSEKDRNEIEQTMKGEVLETSRFPEIVFESDTVSGEMIFQGRYRINMSGNVSLHGTTRNEKVQAQVTAGEEQLRAEGDFHLRQSDYGIKLVKVAGGALKVKDEVKITFDIQAQAAPSAG